MKNPFSKMVEQRSDVFEAREYDTKFLLFCRTHIVAEMWKLDMVAVPHINQRYGEEDPVYRLACLETIKYFKECGVRFKDALEYTGVIPDNLDVAISNLIQKISKRSESYNQEAKKEKKCFVRRENFPSIAGELQ